MESNYNIIQDRNFKRELMGIYEYIAYDLKERKIAIKLVNTIMSKLHDLELFPFAHELYKKEENFEYRKLIVKNHIIIYKINLKEKEIFISHIYNQKFNYNKKINITIKLNNKNELRNTNKKVFVGGFYVQF